MLFTADVHAALADGTVTRTFRTWKRPQVRAGGRYRVGGMLLAVDAVHRIAVSDLTDADAHAAGERDVAALQRRLGDATEVWRVDFHYAGPDDRIALRAWDDLSAEDLDRLQARLRRLDGTGPEPWTRQVLQLIADRPGVVSTELAAVVGMERASFKAAVRKLKDLGLTESLDVGYRLSPRGRAVLAALSGGL